MPTPIFNRVLKSAQQREVILPVLEAYLHDASFPSFTVEVKGMKKSIRPPDGWFHPSTHPMWPERQLYWYLAEPGKLILDPLDPLGTQAVTAGSFWHSFMEVCLLDAGVLLEVEVPVQDDETGSRGHMDGRMSQELFEFKTMNSWKLRKLLEGSPESKEVQESWRDLCPEYNAQGNEYCRMSGYRRIRYLIMGTEYPFPKREVVMDYDEGLARDIKEKYLYVRQAVADQKMPIPCCTPRSKESKACFARAVCPIALA